MISFTDVLRMLKIQREALRSWIKDGYIKQSNPSGTQGQKSYFTKNEVVYIAIFSRLVKLGFDRKVASAITDSVKIEDDNYVCNFPYSQININIKKIRDDIVWP